MKKNIMSLFVWLFFTSILFSGMLLGAEPETIMAKKTTKKAKGDLVRLGVDSVSVSRPMTKKGELEIVVKGILPTPAYQLDHFEINRKKNQVDITPWARYDRNKIVIQMAVPYQEKCLIKGLVPDKKVTLRINGANGVIKKTVTPESDHE
jgi:hypothetical protein